MLMDHLTNQTVEPLSRMMIMSTGLDLNKNMFYGILKTINHLVFQDMDISQLLKDLIIVLSVPVTLSVEKLLKNILMLVLMLD